VVQVVIWPSTTRELELSSSAKPATAAPVVAVELLVRVAKVA
jgi:hypothetical protein